jgi:hypothetical protein
MLVAAAPRSEDVPMDQELAHALADGYERWSASGDRTVMQLFSPDFYDHVSGRRGLGIFDVVAS